MSNKEKDYYENYNYNDRKPVYIEESKLRSDQLDRLTRSGVFCMIPWIHMHAFPDGRAYPCCLGDDKYPIGNFKQDTMESVWNQDAYKTMRKNMLEDQPCKECSKCYEQEANGFISMRNSTNKNFGQHITIVDQTKSD
jgi:radical SAM protein with 4Fe4S-binding SPASM domain